MLVDRLSTDKTQQEFNEFSKTESIQELVFMAARAQAPDNVPKIFRVSSMIKHQTQ